VRAFIFLDPSAYRARTPVPTGPGYDLLLVSPFVGPASKDTQFFFREPNLELGTFFGGCCEQQAAVNHHFFLLMSTAELGNLQRREHEQAQQCNHFTVGSNEKCWRSTDVHIFETTVIF